MAKRLVGRGLELAEGTVRLPEEMARYVRQVLRLSPGAELELCDGQGGLATGRLETLDKRSATVAIETVTRTPWTGPRLTLVQGVGKNDKVDQVTRQATELGVHRLIPVTTARSVATRQNRHERWQGIAEDAIRVSHRLHLPVVEPVQPLETVGAPDGLGLILALDGAEPLGVRLEGQALDDVAVLVGPEGGFTADEIQWAADLGYLPTHLGPHTLRTETAGPTAVALIAFAAGLLGGPTRSRA